MKFFAVVCLLREIVALDTTLHSRTVEYEDVNTTSTGGGVHGMPHASILEAGTSSDVARLSSRHSTDSLTLRRSSQPVTSSKLKVSLGYLKAGKCTQCTPDESGGGCAEECQEPAANGPLIKLADSLLAEDPDIFAIVTCDHKFASETFDETAFRQWYGQERLAPYAIKASTTADCDSQEFCERARQQITDTHSKTLGVRLVVGYKRNTGIMVYKPVLMGFLSSINHTPKHFPKSLFGARVSISDKDDYFWIIGANFAASPASARPDQIAEMLKHVREDRFVMIGDTNIRNRADCTDCDGQVQSKEDVLKAIGLMEDDMSALTNPFYPTEGYKANPLIGKDPAIAEIVNFVAPVKIENNAVVGPLPPTYKRHPMCDQVTLDTYFPSVDRNTARSEKITEELLLDCFYRRHNDGQEYCNPEEPSDHGSQYGCMVNSKHDAEGFNAIQVGHLDKFGFSRNGEKTVQETWPGLEVLTQKTDATVGDHAALMGTFTINWQNSMEE